MAVEHNRANGLQVIESGQLFAPNVTRLAVRRGAYLRSYVHEFITRIAPDLSRAEVEAALSP
jgi:LysR family cys regulon transcriptional activator